MRFRTIAVISAIPLIAATSLSSVRSNLSAFAPPELRRDKFVASAAVQSSETANLYRVNCQMCHGVGGKGLIPEMAFVGRKWKHGTKSSDMAKIITEGVKGTPMLPFKAKLTAVQIRALAKYVRAFDKTLPPEK